MNIKEKYEDLRRVVALVLALSTAQVALPAVMSSSQGDKKDSKRMENGSNGMTLANITDANLFSLLMNTAKAEGNEEAIIETIRSKMAKAFGEEAIKNIGSAESLVNFYLYLSGQLDIHNPDVLNNQGVDAINTFNTILYYKADSNSGEFYISDIMPVDEYGDDFQSKNLREVEELCESLKKSQDKATITSFMEYVVINFILGETHLDDTTKHMALEHFSLYCSMYVPKNFKFKVSGYTFTRKDVLISLDEQTNAIFGINKGKCK